MQIAGMVSALFGCMAHFIGSILFHDLNAARAGDDVAAILAFHGVEHQERTIITRRTLKPRHTRIGMLHTIIAESAIDVSLTMHGSIADFDGVAQALSMVDGLPYDYTTPAMAWDLICSTLDVRSPKSASYFEAVTILATMPGFERAQPCEEAINHRAAELSAAPF
jgi:hypothetical protein